MTMTATIVDADLRPIADYEKIDGDDFSILEGAAALLAQDGTRCAIQWHRSDDGQFGYWGPKGATIQPHWYAKAGRPAEIQGGQRVNVYLDARTIQRATEIGNGSISAGLRRAVEAHR